MPGPSSGRLAGLTEGDEAHGHSTFHRQVVTDPVIASQFLEARRPAGRHQPSAIPQLGQKGGGHFHRGTSQEDGLEGGTLRPTPGTITDPQVDLRQAHAIQRPTGPFRQQRIILDAEDFRGELG